MERFNPDEFGYGWHHGNWDLSNEFGNREFVGTPKKQTWPRREMSPFKTIGHSILRITADDPVVRRTIDEIFSECDRYALSLKICVLAEDENKDTDVQRVKTKHEYVFGDGSKMVITLTSISDIGDIAWIAVQNYNEYFSDTCVVNEQRPKYID